jgi:hypothetical protein
MAGCPFGGTPAAFVQGQVGLNAAGGIGALDLHYAQ